MLRHLTARTRTQPLHSVVRCADTKWYSVVFLRHFSSALLFRLMIASEYKMDEM